MKMQFDLEKAFVGEEEFPVAFPKRYKGKYEDVVFTLRLYTNEEADSITQARLGIDEKERYSVNNLAAYVREVMCALMTKEPKNLAGFPMDERPLYERAKEYFIRPNDSARQAFLDEMLGNAYDQLKNKIEDGAFNSLPEHGAGDSDVQTEASEDIVSV